MIPIITVFTPTYNRAYLLPRCYESLCRQTSDAFEWIIVDDGSMDNTAEVVRGFMTDIQESSGAASETNPETTSKSTPEGTYKPFSGIAKNHTFRITYQRQPNGGKHRAINRGVNLAQGELFLILDSDDYLTDDAIQQVVDHYLPIADNKRCGGLGALKALHNGGIIFPEYVKGEEDIPHLQLCYGRGCISDKCEVHRTSVQKEFPFPEIEGETFCPEALVENRISTKYFLHYFDTAICRCEYLDDGLTKKIVQIRMESPIASMLTYAELTRYPIPWHQRIKAAINYHRFACCCNKKSPVKGIDQGNPVHLPTIKWYWIWTKPLGWLMHLRDKTTRIPLP